MMKLIFFAPFSDGNMKGVERRVEFLAGELRPRGAKVSIIDSKAYRVLIRKFHLSWLISLGLERLAIFVLINAICCARRDHMIISEVIFAPVWRRNFALTVHDLKMFSSNASRGGLTRSVAYSIFLRLATSIIVVSRQVGDDISRLLKNRGNVILISNGISSTRLAVALPFARRRSAAAWECHYDFVYISSFAKHKGHKTIIEAAPVGSRICLIGRDLGALHAIRRVAEARGAEIAVSIHEDVETDTQLFSLLSSAAVAIFPSHFEGFGIPILEYGIVGLKCIASDIPVLRDFSAFVDEFVPAGDAAAWNKAMSASMGARNGGQDRRLDWQEVVHRRALIEQCFGGATVQAQMQSLLDLRC